VANGDFELGSLSSWTPAGAKTGVVNGTAPVVHGGSWAALLGTSAPTNGDSKISQTFSVPTGRTTLSSGTRCPARTP
jgi:hypothetical protein